jgi:hypothetical protein
VKGQRIVGPRKARLLKKAEFYLVQMAKRGVDVKNLYLLGIPRLQEIQFMPTKKLSGVIGHLAEFNRSL